MRKPGRVKGIYLDAATCVYAYDFRVSGVRFRGSTQCTDRREAEIVVKALRRNAQVSTAEHRGATAMTFAVASSRWFDEAGRYRAGQADVVRLLAWLQREIGKSTRIEAIDGNLVARLVSLRRAEGVAPATVNRTVTEPLRAILRRAETWGQRLSPIRWGQHKLKEAEPRPREASAVEEARLMSAMREDFRPLLRFAFLSGMRLAELLAMRWEHIDWAAREIILMGKGDKFATVPLSDEMERVLRGEYRQGASGAVWRYLPRRRLNGEVADLTPRDITLWAFHSQWSRARKRAGLPSTRADKVLGFRFHDSRHTAISRVVRAGGVAAGQGLARHSDPSITLKRYAMVTAEDVRAAMNAAHSPHQISRDTLSSAENIKRFNAKGSRR